jgi:hypothetical protein
MGGRTFKVIVIVIVIGAGLAGEVLARRGHDLAVIRLDGSAARRVLTGARR